VLAVSALSIAAGSAFAGDGASPAQPADPAAGPGSTAAVMTKAPAGKLPAGLVSLQGPLLSAPPLTQTRGTISCPIGTVPFGGGALFSSGDLKANINSSFPTSTGWAADVNNGASFASTFKLFVVCGQKPKLYQQVASGPNDVPASSQRPGIASCPTGTVPFGGGALVNTTSLFVNLNSTFPTANGWRTDVNNQLGSARQFTAFAICARKPAGYTQVVGASVDNPTGLASIGQAFCPGVTAPLGGGVVSATSDTRANLNATFAASGDGWAGVVNNASPFSFTMSVRIVCAGA
jgi:hypothetical protein